MTANTERVVTQTQLARLAEWSMRKPVIALMGEFSSGKSTLMNLLIGQNILPTQVTATRMPPVWLTYGDAPPYRMDHDGQKYPVSLDKADAIPIKTTSYIRLYVKADILKSCDLIDTPGISDPNIKTNYWIRTIRYANAVMWCTHAGQAWRESERGAWEALPTRLRETSILLVTRKDKITSDRDLRKIQRRLERETQTLFNSRMFVSLTNAIKAREKGDAVAWNESGAEDFSEMLEEIVEGIYVQRSFMLARYVTNDGANAKPETESVPDLENGNMLGFVGKAEAERQSDQLVSRQDHSETGVSEVTDGNAQNDRLGSEATAEAVARPDDLNAQPEPKSPRGDLKLDAYAEEHMNSWDCLAAQLIVKEAGGRIEDQDADEMIAVGGRVVVAAPGVFEKLVEIADRSFGQNKMKSAT